MYKIKIQSSLLATVKLAASCFHWQWTSLGVIRGSHPREDFSQNIPLLRHQLPPRSASCHNDSGLSAARDVRHLVSTYENCQSTLASSSSRFKLKLIFAEQ